MSNKEKSIKPIPEQIIEAMISDISQKKEFDEKLLSKIKSLYKNGGLKRPQRITEVIKPNSEAS